MTESEDLKRSECKLRYLRVLEAKQKEIENKEKRCQSLFSTLEDLRERLITIRTERDKLEEECRQKVDINHFQLIKNIRKEAFIETIRDLEMGGLSEIEVLSNLFFTAIIQIAISNTIERSGFQTSEAVAFVSGGELLVTIARRLGCKVFCENQTETECPYDIDHFSNLMDELVSQIVEAKQTQQFD